MFLTAKAVDIKSIRFKIICSFENLFRYLTISTPEIAKSIKKSSVRWDRARYAGCHSVNSEVTFLLDTVAITISQIRHPKGFISVAKNERNRTSNSFNIIFLYSTVLTAKITSNATKATGKLPWIFAQNKTINGTKYQRCAQVFLLKTMKLTKANKSQETTLGLMVKNGSKDEVANIKSRIPGAELLLTATNIAVSAITVNKTPRPYWPIAGYNFAYKTSISHSCSTNGNDGIVKLNGSVPGIPEEVIVSPNLKCQPKSGSGIEIVWKKKKVKEKRSKKGYKSLFIIIVTKGGGGEIRTHETLADPGFPNPCHRPLGDSSKPLYYN